VRLWRGRGRWRPRPQGLLFSLHALPAPSSGFRGSVAALGSQGQGHAPRLVATDLDGTIVRRDGTISALTVAALERVEEGGVAQVVEALFP
jgi:hypothetical protein